MIPKSFNLGGRKWTVVYEDTIEKGRVFGQWNDEKAEVRLAKRVVSSYNEDELTECSEYQLLNSFWHEYGHILQYYSTGHTDDVFAQTFATFMTEFNLTKEL